MVSPGERRGGEERRLAAGRDHDEAARLAELRGDLGDQFAAGHTDAEIEPAAGLDLVTKTVRHGIRGAQQRLLAGEIEVGLVERDRLDDRRVAIEDGEDRLRGLSVRREVTGNEDGVWTEAPRSAERHRRADAERSGFVRGRGNHAPLALDAGPTDDHRLARPTPESAVLGGGIKR